MRDLNELEEYAFVRANSRSKKEAEKKIAEGYTLTNREIRETIERHKRCLGGDSSKLPVKWRLLLLALKGKEQE